MSERALDVGDEVLLSAAFLRSMGTQSLSPGGGGWSTRDRGPGVIIGFAPDWPDLAYVRWDSDPGVARGVNVCNLVHRKDAHHEASRAESQRVTP